MSVVGIDETGSPQGGSKTYLLPPLVLAVLVLVAVLPVGLPSSARFVLPMLPFAAIHYWTLNDRGFMPAVLVFAAGLTIDLVTYGPLGFWSCVFLIGHACARWLSGPISDTRIGRYTGYVLTCALLGWVQWIVASLYYLEWVDAMPFALAGAATTLFYPLLAILVFTPSPEKASSA